MAETQRPTPFFRECLEVHKETERPEAVLLAAQDRQRVRLLLAWEKIGIRRKRRLSPRPKDATDRGSWEWLWENVTYSLEEWAAVSGLSNEVTERLAAVLRGNRLIYPDGTVNRFAAQYLKTKVWGLFQPKNGSTQRSKKGLAKTNNT